MKKQINPFIGILILWMVSACSSVRVLNTEAAQGFSLAKYRTFGFMDASTDSISQDIPAEHITSLQQEVASQLQKRGLTMATTNPDLFVNLGVVVQEKTQTRQTDFRTDPPNYIGQRRYSWKTREVEVGKYKEGTISVHLVDRAQNTLVWSSEAESVVPNKNEKVQERIAEGVEKLFSSIPATNATAN